MKKDFLVSKFLENHIIEGKDFEIYKFGMECLILKSITLAICGIVALCLKKPSEFLLILTAFILVRRCAGGYHARTKHGCVIFSCFSIIISLLLCELDVAYGFHILILLCIDIGLLLIGPIDNENNRFSDDERKIFKKKTCITLLAINIVCFCFLFINITIIYVPLISGLTMSFFFVLMGKIQENKYCEI